MRWRAVPGEQTGEHRQDIITVQPALNMDSQTLPAMFINNGEQLQGFAVMGAICNKVVAPDMATILRSEPDA